jgi:hypothetical protein
MNYLGVREYRAETWEVLQQLLFRNAWRDDIARVRSPYVFRGQSNAAYALESSLQRYVSGTDRWDLENHLLRGFARYARKEMQARDIRIGTEFVALAQHYGLPTRSIDWTYSPFVAAYFATRGRPDVDGVIWAVDYAKVHEHLPAAFRRLLDEPGVRMFEADMLDDNLYRGLAEAGVPVDILDHNGTTLLLTAKGSWEAIATEVPDDFVVFYEAPSVDERIVNQSALFSVTADPRTRLDEWLARTVPDAVMRIVIPAECKLEFRDRLAQANVTAKSLFPGLDGISAWLCEYYRPRPDASQAASSGRAIEPTPALSAG